MGTPCWRAVSGMRPAAAGGPCLVDPLQHATAGVQHATCNMPSPADAKRHGNMGTRHGRTASVAGAKAGELKLMPATVSGGGACSVPRISGISCTMLRAGMGPWCSIVVCMLDTYRAAVGCYMQAYTVH